MGNLKSVLLFSEANRSGASSIVVWGVSAIIDRDSKTRIPNRSGPSDRHCTENAHSCPEPCSLQSRPQQQHFSVSANDVSVFTTVIIVAIYLLGGALIFRASNLNIKCRGDEAWNRESTGFLPTTTLLCVNPGETQARFMDCFVTAGSTTFVGFECASTELLFLLPAQSRQLRCSKTHCSHYTHEPYPEETILTLQYRGSLLPHE